MDIEIAVSIQKIEPLKATVKLDEEGTALFQKYYENLNQKVEQLEPLKPQKALIQLIFAGFRMAEREGLLR